MHLSAPMLLATNKPTCQAPSTESCSLDLLKGLNRRVPVRRQRGPQTHLGATLVVAELKNSCRLRSLQAAVVVAQSLSAMGLGSSPFAYENADLAT